MNRKKLLLKLLLPCASILAYFLIPAFREFIHHSVVVLKSLDVAQVKAYILSFGPWAPVISFLLMIFQSIAAPLPAFLITFSNAALFGWIAGAALSWSSAMAGATLCFYIARWYGRNTVAKLTSHQALEQTDAFFDQYGNYAVLIARLLPFISFDIVSYAAGLTSMSFWSFFWATGLGQLPATLIYSYVGGVLTGSVRTFVTGLLIIFSVSAMVAFWRKWRKMHRSA